MQEREQAREAASRSRKGAWIEIIILAPFRLSHAVAPARERGLKSVGT